MSAVVKLQSNDYVEANKHLMWHTKRYQALLQKNDILNHLSRYCEANSQNIEDIFLNEQSLMIFSKDIQADIKLSESSQILALILLAQKQLAYIQYKEYVGTQVSSVEDVIRQSYSYDLKYHKKMDLKRIKRLLLELKLTNKKDFLADYKISLCYKREAYDEQLRKRATALMNNLRQESRDETLTREIVGVATAYACNMSFDLKDYETDLGDFKHFGNPLEDYYRKNCTEALITAYDGCAKCHRKNSEEKPLQLSYLWKEKNEGGNYAMRSIKGQYVNNSMPLCEACKAEKGAQSSFLLFSQDEMITLLHVSQSLDQVIDHKMSGFEDPHFKGRRKFD